MSGRARGRGRAREPPAQQQQQAPRRPAAAPAAAPSRPPVGTAGDPSAHGGNGNGGNGAGRASHRGGARGEAMPGPVAAVATQMDRMTMGTRNAGERGRRGMSFTEVHTRPAHVTDKKGADEAQPVNLVANYYRLESRPGWAMYQYRVDFAPKLDNFKLCRGLLATQRETLGQFVFDGTIIFSLKKLPDKTTEMVVQTHRGEQFKITITFTNEIPVNDPTCIQQYNILLRQCMKDLDMKEVQRAHYDQGAAVQLKQHGLEIWPGFKTSILQYEDSLLLNLDVSHKVLRTDTVLSFMYRLYQANQQNFTAVCQKQLIGQVILTRYNNKTYRVDDFEWDMRPESTFKRTIREKVGDQWERREEEITFKRYFETTYQCTVNDMQQPLLVSRVKKGTDEEGKLAYLLPELCTMTGLTDDQRNNFNLMKDMGSHTRLTPAQRVQTMSTFMNRIKSHPKSAERMKNWDLRFSNSLVEIQGRRLPQEQIVLGKKRGSPTNEVITANKDADFDRDLKGQSMYTSVNLTNWLLVYTQRDEPLVNKLMQTLQRVAPPLGMQLSAPMKAATSGPRIDQFIAAISKGINPDLQMVICVLPSNKKDLYDAIKKHCCVTSPVPSQCVTGKKLMNDRGIMSVVTKIAIQLNCKLGGEAWAVKMPRLNAMVIGYDTYHDSSKKGRSVGGFVASLNQTFTRYYSQVSFQSAHEELISGIKFMLVGALKKYHSINSTLPEKIIIYRDGVGDGQLAAVYENELSEVVKAIHELGQDYRPALVFIVVKKRINSRFMQIGGRDSLENPLPGTVVDSVVTRKEWYDFYLVSQSVRQGTASPVHFNVIHDTSTNLGPSRIQKLTYKLCHLYYNWPATVRVPAPCQYAHKLAFLTGQHLHQQADLSLADKLYFL